MKDCVAVATILKATHSLDNLKHVQSNRNAVEAVSIIYDAVYALTESLNITDEVCDNLHNVQGSFVEHDFHEEGEK